MKIEINNQRKASSMPAGRSVIDNVMSVKPEIMVMTSL